MFISICIYSTLKYPELLVSKIIDRVVIINGAIGGSPLADNVSDNFMGRFFTQYLDVGLLSLQPETANINFKIAFESFKEIIKSKQCKQIYRHVNISNTDMDNPNPDTDNSARDNSDIDNPPSDNPDRDNPNPDTDNPGPDNPSTDNPNTDDMQSLTSHINLFEDVSSRVFYIRSQRPEGDLSWGIKSVLFFCKGYLDENIPNDGLLYCSDQILDGFGVDLGVIESDHIDLVIGGMVTVSDAYKRRAFTRAIFSAIYQ